MRENRGKVSYLRVAVGSIAQCWRAHPSLFVALMAVSALLCGIEVGEVFAMRRLFDAVARYIQGAVALDGVGTAALPLAAVLVAGPLVRILEYLGQGYFWRRGSGYLMARYHQRIQRIPLIEFEKAETFDRMAKARLGSEDAPSASRTVIQFAFHFLPYLMLTSAFLFSVRPLLVAVLGILFASVALAQLLRSGIVRRFEERNAGLRRQTEYLQSCITDRQYAKETRTLGAVGYFFGMFVESIRRLNQAATAVQRRIAAVELLLRVVNILGYAGILALLVHDVAAGVISVGAFAAVFYSVERISSVLKTMVDQFGEALQEMATASFTHEFLRTPKEDGDPAPLDKRVDIRLERVCFAYPGGREAVLRDISLTIGQGETVAIVGENGAGKTTLTQVILGLYAPTGGTVRYGTRDIHDYTPPSRFGGVSAVFQNFVRYSMTARENIQISDMESSGAAEQAAAQAGADVAHLPRGLDTMLCREFDGVELSGGQWQRLAIARGLYRRHDVIVLDEPTAAIDPIEESNLFRLFRETAAGKTAILVTHRLGCAKIADRILVMEAGQICEQGTHEQLLAQGGVYARMYREQAGWYLRVY